MFSRPSLLRDSDVRGMRRPWPARTLKALPRALSTSSTMPPLISSTGLWRRRDDSGAPAIHEHSFIESGAISPAAARAALGKASQCRTSASRGRMYGHGPLQLFLLAGIHVTFGETRVPVVREAGSDCPREQRSETNRNDFPDSLSIARICGNARCNLIVIP
jgi:hypothetical protein